MKCNIVPREKWWCGARPLQPPFGFGANRPAKKVFYQNTHSPPCPNDTFCRGYLRHMQFKYTNYFKNDIVYNFMIGGDGTVYEGRGWNTAPRLPREYIDDCEDSILIAFIGYYLKHNLPPKMSSSFQNLIDFGIEWNQISKGFMYHNIMIPKRFNDLSYYENFE